MSGSPASTSEHDRRARPPARPRRGDRRARDPVAIATNLPEIAITASAALSHDLGIAIGNILGGIAIQTVVLVVLDAVGLGAISALTYRAASLVLVLECGLVVAVLVVAIGGTQLPAA